jgi:hypothetical protein
MSVGAFGRAQPQYAAHDLPTFPVRFVRQPDGKLDKIPAIAGYMRIGIRGSTALVPKFRSAEGIGLVCGRRSKLVVVDVDTPDENVVADVVSVHGGSPLVARTPSGGHHVLYRHGGGQERRRIRLPYWTARNAPVDVLAGGMVVLPPSHGPNGQYAFVEGTLDDLDRLPVFRDAPGPAGHVEPEHGASIGQRNNKLLQVCGRAAAKARSFDEVLDVAREFNARCIPPEDDARVIRTAESAWKYQLEGTNRFGGPPGIACLPMAVFDTLSADQLYLFGFLRAHNGSWSEFMCTNSLAKRFGWDERRLVAARLRLAKLGYIECARPARGPGRAALFRWAKERNSARF